MGFIYQDFIEHLSGGKHGSLRQLSPAKAFGYHVGGVIFNLKGSVAMTKYIKYFLSVLVLSGFLAASVQAGKNDPMYVPEPIEISGGKSTEEVKRAVRKALFDEGFQARDIASGQVQGKRSKSGKHGAYSATVNINYDSRNVRIAYANSENLNYNAKNKTIHGTYNRWVRNIEKRVRKNLGAY